MSSNKSVNTNHRGMIYQWKDIFVGSCGIKMYMQVKLNRRVEQNRKIKRKRALRRKRDKMNGMGIFLVLSVGFNAFSLFFFLLIVFRTRLQRQNAAEITTRDLDRTPPRRANSTRKWATTQSPYHTWLPISHPIIGYHCF